MKTPKWAGKKIIWKNYTRTHNDFGIKLREKETWLEGWGAERSGTGIFDSYVSALAANMGVWEEYCEFFRNKKAKE